MTSSEVLNWRGARTKLVKREDDRFILQCPGLWNIKKVQAHLVTIFIYSLS